MSKNMEECVEVLKQFFLAGVCVLSLFIGICECAIRNSVHAQEVTAPQKSLEKEVLLKDGNWTFEVGNVNFTFTKPDKIVAINAQAQGVHIRMWRQNDDKSWRLLTKFHLAASGSQAELGNVMSPKQEGRLNAELLKNGTFQKNDIFWIQVENTPEKFKEIGQAWKNGLSEAISGKKAEEKDKKKATLLGNTIITLKEQGSEAKNERQKTLTGTK